MNRSRLALLVICGVMIGFTAVLLLSLIVGG